ncbi:MAG: hydrogenase [Helicobacteraceae bacterium CG1_02_36_14]|nr:MAG: hydrogenase [Helicobacteraceae bacterium CG1_02_36_14]
MKTQHKEMYDAINALLGSYAVNGHAKYILAPYVARVSLEMNHMYADLNFKSRSEMGRFMMKNFPKLAEQKPKEKLWKKFLYDMIGAVAPACGNCDDQETCFKCIVSEMSA